jgi:hypothetical protein
LTDFSAQRAFKHNLTALVLGFAGALASVVLTLTLAAFAPVPALWLIYAAIFAAFSLAWGYAIALKARRS